MCGGRPTFVSACCGATFAPGAGPDNIVDLRSKLGTLAPEDTLTVTTTEDHRRDLAAEHARNDALPAAYREGECPACGAETPLMHLADGSPCGGDCGGPSERSAVGGLGDLVRAGLAYLGELAICFLAGAGAAALWEALAPDVLAALSRLAGDATL
jgi:hypothetical protein